MSKVRYVVETAEMIIQKSTQFKIDPNVKDDNGETAFDLACREGNSIKGTKRTLTTPYTNVKTAPCYSELQNF